MKQLYADYFRVLGSARRRARVLVFLIALSGLLEICALTTLIPLFDPNAVLDGNGFLSSRARERELSARELSYLSLVLFVVLGLLSAVAKFFADAGVLRLRIGVERDMRGEMARSLLHMDWSAFHGMRLGDITKAVIAEGNHASLGLQALLQASGNIIVAALFLIAAIALAPTLTLFTLVFGAVVGIAYRAANKRMDEWSRELSMETSRIGEETESVFGSLKYIRSTGGAAAAGVRTRHGYDEFARKSFKAHVLVPALRLLFESSALVFVASVLLFSLLQHGRLDASAIAIVALFYRLAPRLHIVQEHFILARSYRSWLLTWHERLTLAQSLTDHASGTVAPSYDHEIRIERVVHHYPNAPIPALRGVDLDLPRGSCVAIVGESGSGKSTILDLVSGLLRPTGGRVTVDGVSMHDIDRAAWQSHIGVVMQDNPIYHATVAENIAWQDPVLDPDRVREAAAAANALGFIEALDAGFDTVVGERGGRLSGGQRQRLALARAVYRRPWLLLLDEATSALDSESEGLVLEALEQFKGRQSMVLVAHRLATAQIADVVYVLHQGRVVQAGTFDALLQDRDGRFAKMALSQGLIVPAG